MPKFTMCKGLPASGKSTWALEQLRLDANTVSVEKDVIRRELGAAGGGKNEKIVLAERNRRIELAMISGYNIISSDTNFNPRHENHFRQLCHKAGYEFEVKFFDISVEDAVKRDLQRQYPVGKDVILQMWYQYIVPTKRIYNYDPALPDCIICDLDGTLCLFGDKNPYDRDFTQDDLNIPVKFLVNQAYENNLRVFLFSGRKSEFRDQTQNWLDFNCVRYHELFMRPDDDNRKDSQIKMSLYLEHIHLKYNPIFVIDDRQQVVNLWRELGLFVFDVNQGGYAF